MDTAWIALEAHENRPLVQKTLVLQVHNHNSAQGVFLVMLQPVSKNSSAGCVVPCQKNSNSRNFLHYDAITYTVRAKYQNKNKKHSAVVCNSWTKPIM